MRTFKKLISAVTASAMTLSMTAGSVSLFGTVNAADLDSMTAVELVEDMGAGWNLGNSLDCYWNDASNGGAWGYKSIEEQERGWGEVITTESLIKSVAFYGFDTIRIPVTWYGHMDSSGNIDADYLARVKEVVDYAYDNGLYVILNMHHDGASWNGGSNWLTGGTAVKDRFTNAWFQIAEEFKSYDRHLVFEGWNEITFDDSTQLAMAQAFVDTIRDSSGNNKKRLLLIPGNNTNYEKTTSSSYQLPTDSANMLAVDIHYYDPTQFTVYSDDDDPWGGGIQPQNSWGSADEIAKVKNDFAALKGRFTDQGIGVIIGEYGVENYNKDEASRVLFTKTVASAAYEMTGVCPVLWDAGDMKYYNRASQSWNNPEVGEFFKELTGGTYVNEDGLVLTDRVTIKGTKDGNAMVWSIEPFRDKAVLKTARWSFDAEGLTEDGYYGLAAFQANQVDTTYEIDEDLLAKEKAGTLTDEEQTELNNQRNTKYQWSYRKTSIAQDPVYYEDDLTEWFHAVDNVDTPYEAPFTLDYDYLKLETWYVGSDGTAPTLTPNENLTLVFESPVWVDPNTFEIPDPVEDETDAPTEEPTAEPATDEPEPPTQEETSAGELQVTIWGDADNDGDCDIIDVICVNKDQLGSYTLDAQGIKNADVDQNGIMAFADAVNIMKSLVDLVTLPVA